MEKSESTKRQVIGYTAYPIEHPTDRESALGNLTADAMRAKAQTDFAFITRGSLRAPIDAGPITFGSVFRAFPFDNEIVKIKISGKELYNLLRVAESGGRGFASVSGLKLKLIEPHSYAPANDLNGDGRDDLWKINRLLEVKTSDGNPILPDQFYILATTDFISTGGDDMKWPMSQIPHERIQMTTGLLARDALVEYIQNEKKLNSPPNLLVNPENPRLQFVKPKTKTTKTRRTGRRQ